MPLKTELENYFNNSVYPSVKDTMRQNIAKMLQDADLYDNLPDDISDDVKTELLNDINSRLLRIKEANNALSTVYNGGKR
jgi:cobalamin biosynthesis Mg chelatase CobN